MSSSILDTCGAVWDRSKCPDQRSSIISDVVSACTYLYVRSWGSKHLIREVSVFQGVLLKVVPCKSHEEVINAFHALKLTIDIC